MADRIGFVPAGQEMHGRIPGSAVRIQKFVRRRKRRARAMQGVALIFAVLVAVTGCATMGSNEPVPAGRSLQPLTQGWEQHLAVTWSLDQRPGGQSVDGYVRNISPYDLANVRVLVEGLDANGQVAAQYLGRLPGELRGGGRLYFEVPVVPAASYRVRVFSYERLESAGLMS